MALSLLLFGFAAFVLAVVIAHVGIVFLVLAVPALMLSVIVGITAFPFSFWS